MSRREMKLGEILMADGLILPWQLELALAVQQRTRQFLGEIMMEKEWITDEQLTAVLAQQFDIPLEPRIPEDTDWTVAGKYPQLVDEHSLCFPVKSDAESLWVAISNPLDAWTISMIEKQARGKTVHLVLATSARIKTMYKELRARNLSAE